MVKKYIERYWRKATKEDSVRDPMMDARFRAAVKSDQEYGEDPAKDLVMDAMFRATAAGCDWVYGKLYGWDRETNLWSSEENCGWDEAEVYDAPDPGEGYELIDPATDKPSRGDERFNAVIGQWQARRFDGESFDDDTFYRRKIQPSPTSEVVATPTACKRTVAVRVNVDGKDVLVRPLLPSDEINSGDILIKDGTWERAYTAVGLLQSNADHQYYREVRPQPKSEPEATVTKPEAAEPVTFVAHPIQVNEELEYCFQGKPIQFRSYAVLNEQGHYLQHLPAYPPQYAPEFRQAFTPLQLLQLSVRELGSNIRLRAVEPMGEPQAKSDSAEPIALFVHPIETMCVKGVRSYALRGKMIANRSYAVMNKEGKFLYTLGDGEPVFLETFCQAFTPLQLREVHSQYIQNIELRAVEPINVEKLKQEYMQELKEQLAPKATQPVKKSKYVPFEWEDREQLRGRWLKQFNGGGIIEEVAYRFDSRVFDKVAKRLLEDDWVFLDTGERVGKRVED